MKILHISQSDTDGGAAKAAYRLCTAQRNIKLSSELFVMRKFSNSEFVFTSRSIFSLFFSRVLPQIDRILKKIFGIKSNYPWSLNLISNPLIEVANTSRYDLVHLHWIGKNMLNHSIIKKIDKPIVWTLHDSWPFTAGCHIPKQCEGYKTNCYECPQIIKRNGTIALLKYMYNKKNDIYEKNSIHFIAPSNWIANCARSSRLLMNSSIHVIPNAICTKTFQPFNKTESLDFFNLPKNKSIILFGAMYADTDQNKGLDLLIEALSKLRESDLKFFEKLVLVVFGASSNFCLQNFGIVVINVGIIEDQTTLAKLYSAATVTVVPSRSESFGQVAAESLSCGTPVVAFKSSGLIDIVDHRTNGYLANPYETNDLADGIQFVTINSGNVEFKKNARAKVTSRFDSRVVASAHHKLYESIINKY